MDDVKPVPRGLDRDLDRLVDQAIARVRAAPPERRPTVEIPDPDLPQDLLRQVLALRHDPLVRRSPTLASVHRQLLAATVEFLVRWCAQIDARRRAGG